MTDQPMPPVPIACDMSGAIDTAEERLAEYKRLFVDHLIGRERSDDGIRFRFTDRPGLADWVRDLSDREHSCCPFMFFQVHVHDGELQWDISTVDDDAARIALDGLYNLPESAIKNVDDLVADYASRGLNLIASKDGFEQASP